MAVTITKDMTGLMKKAVRAMQKTEVLVGIPDENAERKPEDGKQSEISNAGIGYVMEFGSPEQNIPARPSLIPGVSGNKDKITKRLRKAGELALTGKIEEVEKSLIAVGLECVSAVRAKITDGPFVPLSERTLAARRARGRTGIKPLIDTGQFRNAFTSVLHEKGKD